MGRRTPSTSEVIAYIATVPAVPEVQTHKLKKGSYTLAPNTTYVFFADGQDMREVSMHAQWSAGTVITSMYMERTNQSTNVAAGTSVAAGDHVPCKGSDMVVDVYDSTGVTVTTGVVAVTAGGQNAALFNLRSAARRHHLKVVVGATGGEMIVAVWGAE